MFQDGTLKPFSCALNVISRNLFNPNKNDGFKWNKSVWTGRGETDGVWFLESAFPCVGRGISWTEASSCLCLTPERACFLNTCLPSCSPPSYIWLFFFFFFTYSGPGNLELIAHLQQVWTLFNLQLQGVMESITPQRSMQSRKEDVGVIGWT